MTQRLSYVRAAVSSVVVILTVLATEARPLAGGMRNDKDPAPSTSKASSPWDMTRLREPPAMVPAPEFESPDVRAIFYDGPRWKEKPTRVFGWYGLPREPREAKLPAMILVHGGGGTAFAEWVRLWTSRGFAALAMDTCGCVPGGEHGKRPRHAHGGPPGWGGFDQIDEPVEDQWTYHAVADVILANSLLRSFPEIDADRIGLTGISWGGFLTAIVAGVDDRFRFAVPVYGCGFLAEESAFVGRLEKMGEKRAARWLELWDPSRYLPRARMPFLWVTGTNDFAFPLSSLERSYQLPRSKQTLAIRVRMPHGHGGPGEKPEEIHAFAEHHLRGGPPLPTVRSSGEAGGRARVRFDVVAPLAGAELIYTKDTGKWSERTWHTTQAQVHATQRRVTATLPRGVTVWYINLVDGEGRIVSSPHHERAVDAPPEREGT